MSWLPTLRAWRGPSLAALALASAGASAAPAADDVTARYHAAIAACEAKPAPSVRYVAATSARLRSYPGESGPPGDARSLPIATRVEVQCEIDGWMRGVGDHAVGWIRSDLLAERAPTLDSLAAQFQAAAPAERVLLAERAIALAPHQERGHDLLAAALRETGDTAAAERARQLRQRLLAPTAERLPGEPDTLFVVEQGQVRPLAQPDGRGGYIEAQADHHLDRSGSQYFPQWRSLHFYRRGGADGIVQVIAPDRYLEQAGVRHPPATAIAEDLIGIASNWALPGAAAKAPPAASVPAAARKQAERELESRLRGLKAAPAQIAKALAARPGREQPFGLSLHALAPGPRGPIFVATVQWEEPVSQPEQIPPVLDAVAVLESDGRGGYVAAGGLAQRTVGDTVKTHAFLDQADLDGDGEPELLFRLDQYEGNSLEIWRRKDGRWTPVFEGAYVGA